MKGYKYTLRPFQDVKQDHIILGRNFGGWENNYTAMKYVQGEKCWDGPVRSITVNLICGLRDEIIKVEEPSRCEYAMMFTSPTACDLNHANVLRLNLEQSLDEENPETIL